MSVVIADELFSRIAHYIKKEVEELNKYNPSSISISMRDNGNLLTIDVIVDLGLYGKEVFSADFKVI